MSDESAEAFARRLERETAEQFNQGKAPPKPRAKKASKKAIEATESSVFEALRTHPALHAGAMFRLDTFAAQIRVCHPIPVKGVASPAWKPSFLSDVDIAHLIVWLQDNGYVKVSEQKVRRAVVMEAHRNQYSSALLALLGMPAWDGTVRMDTYWQTVCGAETFEDGMTEDEIFNRARYLGAVARSFFISIIARIRKPGAKVDHMPVLEGEQGAQKSTLMEIFCLDNEEWFSDSMSADIANKDAKAHLTGKMIVEMAEMHQLKASDIEATKRFISSRIDKFRPSYGRNEIAHPRQCVFLGTTNHTNYLRDETGNRRFWPISCGKIDIALARQMMPQIYAEALHAYNSSEDWWLSKDLEAIAEAEQDQRITEDPWEEGVAEVIRAERIRCINGGERVFWVTALAALKGIEPDRLKWTPDMLVRMRRMLRKKGGKNKKLPRGKGWPNNAYRFVIDEKEASNAEGEAQKVVRLVRPGTDK